MSVLPCAKLWCVIAAILEFCLVASHLFLIQPAKSGIQVSHQGQSIQISAVFNLVLEQSQHL